MPQILQQLHHWVGSRKLSINPLELLQHNLIHQVPFTMPAAIREVHAEYHNPVRIHKAMNSGTAGCCYKLSCI